MLSWRFRIIPLSYKARLLIDVKEVKPRKLCSLALREIVEKVASAPRLNEALNILVTDICLAMDTEVCSVYLADHDRRCYYLMATRGVEKTAWSNRCACV
ncbi:phosphoenolpyruvate-protein phosphotransferase [Salmonella enterica subsp. enterica serovar Pullorum]|nr:phosphoenolpyruvate-protein phosphotransferase [Salmonella enterica subsp. enterica serovar Pullorum]